MRRTILIKERQRGAYNHIVIQPEDLHPNFHFDAIPLVRKKFTIKIVLVGLTDQSKQQNTRCLRLYVSVRGEILSILHDGDVLSIVSPTMWLCSQVDDPGPPDFENWS